MESSEIEILVLGKHLLHRLDRNTFRVNTYARPYPSARICLRITNWSVHGIEITELEPADPALRNLDPQATLEQFIQDDAKTINVPFEKIDWESVPEKYR